MDPQQTYVGRKEHERDERWHLAEVAVRAEPCAGETQVLLAPDVLETLREVFGADFEHQRHCIQAAVGAQIESNNVAEQMPHAGAASFRAEVVAIEVSGYGDRELFGFLFSVAGMDAIADYLQGYEVHQRVSLGDLSFPESNPDDDASSQLDDPEIAKLEAQAAEFWAQMTEEDLRTATYSSAYIMLKVYLNQGWTEAEIRSRVPQLFDAPEGPYPEAVLEARAEALAGRPMRYKSRF